MTIVFINGLIPGDDSISNGDNGGSIVALLDPDFEKGDEKFIIFIKYANSMGKVVIEIDDSFIGKTLLLRIRDAGTLPISASVTVEEYGVCYSARILNDGIYSRSHPIVNWNSDAEYTKAQDEMHEFIKQHRYINPAAKYIHMSVVLVSVLLSLFLPSTIGVVAAAIFVILAEIICPYALGLKPFRLTSRVNKHAQTKAA